MRGIFAYQSPPLRIIGRGGFGEVYGCRKADTGKMYAMKVRGGDCDDESLGY